MDFGGVKFEIKSIDSQDSLNAGVLVVVTGTMWSKDSKRDFVQTFFLAPQEKGYYVLNDISRYLEEEPLFDNPQQHTGDSVMSNGVAPPVEQSSEVLFAVPCHPHSSVCGEAQESAKLSVVLHQFPVFSDSFTISND